jgi:hypothetical protein
LPIPGTLKRTLTFSTRYKANERYRRLLMLLQNVIALPGKGARVRGTRYEGWEREAVGSSLIILLSKAQWKIYLTALAAARATLAPSPLDRSLTVSKVMRTCAVSDIFLCLYK